MEHTVTAPTDGVLSRARGRGPAPRWRPARCWPWSRPTAPQTKENSMTRSPLHRVRGAPGAAHAGGAAGRRSTAASTSPSKARAGRKHHRPVAGDRQARLPRGQPPRGVRRRRRRHRRHRGGAGGAGRGRLPAADDGGLPGDLRHRSSPASAPRSRSSAGCPASPTASITMAFAITEPDAGSNSHNITTTARRDGDDWVLNGRKIYISGVDEAARGARRRPHRGREDRQAQALPVRGADRRARLRVHRRSRWRSSARSGSSRCSSTTSGCPPTRSSGDEDAGLVQLFAGLNPERIMAAVVRDGHGPLRARQGAPTYVKERDRSSAARSAPTRRSPTRWPQSHIEIELARLMMQKAAALLRRRRRHGRRRGREHGEVRRRRGRLRRRRPGRPVPRRQRHHPGVRRRRPAGRLPGRPDRPRSAGR